MNKFFAASSEEAIKTSWEPIYYEVQFQCYRERDIGRRWPVVSRWIHYLFAGRKISWQAGSDKGHAGYSCPSTSCSSRTRASLGSPLAPFASSLVLAMTASPLSCILPSAVRCPSLARWMEVIPEVYGQGWTDNDHSSE